MLSPEERGGIERSSSNSAAAQSLLQCFLFFLIIFLCVAEGVPGINESHYLPKAKHLWDSEFAPGDLFLQSHDSHFLTSAMAGLAARFFSLDGVAWLGRTISWGLMAWAWLILCRSVKMPLLVRPFVLASWLLAIHYGHWAGEWVVGGFEAKTIAYPLVICGLANVVTGNWKWVWLAMGGAMAWHPLVGGWAGLGAGLVWLLQLDFKRQFTVQLPWLILGAIIALIGVVPAASGLEGPDVVDKVSAAQVHVFMRLPHHLAPQTFALNRHWAAIASLVVFVLASLLVANNKSPIASKVIADRVTVEANSRQDVSLSAGLRRLLLCGWVAVLFAAIGLAIDLTLSQARPDIAARLLRFYWFRWADVAVPLISSLLIWKWLAHSLPQPELPSVSIPAPKPNWLSQSLLVAAVLTTFIVILGRLQLNEAQVIPAADQLVVDSIGRHPIQTDRYTDWLAVCQWIRETTPTDSLWLTPRYQQSFKWHAQRAEVVCWKDVPQDNASVIEWYHRIERCAPPRDRYNRLRDWTTEELLELSCQYGFRWILVDRTQQLTPPALEIKYPVTENGEYIENRSFAVLYVPDALLPDAAMHTLNAGHNTSK